MAAAHPSSSPAEITKFGSWVYFSAETAAHGREVWTSDGTPNGTFELLDINPTDSSNPGWLTVVGTHLVTDINPG